MIANLHRHVLDFIEWNALTPRGIVTPNADNDVSHITMRPRVCRHGRNINSHSCIFLPMHSPTETTCLPTATMQASPPTTMIQDAAFMGYILRYDVYTQKSSSRRCQLVKIKLKKSCLLLPNNNRSLRSSSFFFSFLPAFLSCFLWCRYAEDKHRSQALATNLHPAIPTHERAPCRELQFRCSDRLINAAHSKERNRNKRYPGDRLIRQEIAHLGKAVEHIICARGMARVHKRLHLTA
ncbi:hypothetical protein F4782DRAFT_325587 [Xylaria castorea]|nr:hypothetical protein F4782DRAFT_325587 [Xylaria castorea]